MIVRFLILIYRKKIHTLARTADEKTMIWDYNLSFQIFSNYSNVFSDDITLYIVTYLIQCQSKG